MSDDAPIHECESEIDHYTGHVVPGVVVYLTFTLMYGGVITHSFSTCKLHLKQSGKVPQPVL